MDLVSLLNPGLHIELKSEKEVLEELLEDHYVEGGYPGFRGTDQKAKCGRILLSAPGHYTVMCNACDGRFDSMESFTNHLKTNHSDYGLRSDGWGKITTADESGHKKEEFGIGVDTKAGVTSSLGVHNTSKNIAAKKCRRKNCSSSDRQLDSKKAFLQRKEYHKERFDKQEPTHLGHDNQEGTSIELKVKEELDIADYQIQDPVYDARSVGTIEDESSDSSNGKGRTEDPDYMLKSKCRPSLVFTLKPQYDKDKKICITCNRQFDSKKTFRIHMNNHNRTIRKWKIDNGISPETTISCEFCSKQFRLEDRLRQHVVKRHGSLQVSPKFDDHKLFCITCNRAFCSLKSLGMHKQIHKVRDRRKQSALLKDAISCEFCGRQFETDDRFRRHSVLRHGDAIPMILKGDPTYLQCRFCFKQFETPTERHKHEMSHDGEKSPYRCPLCCKTFSRLLSRKIHELMHEENGSGWEPEVQPKLVFSKDPKFDDEKLFCITCNRGFPSESSLKNHKQKHRERILMKSGISCEICRARLRSKNGIRRHIVQHHGDKIPPSFKDDPTYLKCRFCYMEFEKPTERYRHEESHSKEKSPYHCSLCPQSFRRQCLRKVHELIHREIKSENPRPKRSERKSYLSEATICCDFCSRKFKSQAGLREHIVPHHGDKIPTCFKDDPTYLECRFCYKPFKKPTIRFRHEKSHAKEHKPYRCPLCPRSFGKNWSREQHKTIHSEVPLFRCLQCPKSYKLEQSLIYHVRYSHYDIKSNLSKTSGESFDLKSNETSHKLSNAIVENSESQSHMESQEM
ncbi:unnamed protein product [Hermetia illucens]|uniref:C2H2-type domain-containing protein n=2 Tax=Hermetia illucens TaxID=343691 RepID=A0A7R8UH14_HERIL|nr:unnamed protein product [Hermetia illucens]